MPIDDYGDDRSRCPAQFAGARCELPDRHQGRCRLRADVFFNRGTLTNEGVSSVQIKPVEAEEER